jgi:DNA-directed RNA polymerase specialized sigma24 family protein
MEPRVFARAIRDMTPTDADAIRCSLAEPAAFGAVFDRHFAAVHAFAQRRVGSGLAEEVAAEAFARAFAARKRYDHAHPVGRDAGTNDYTALAGRRRRRQDGREGARDVAHVARPARDERRRRLP